MAASVRAQIFSKRECQLAMYSSWRAGGGGISVTMMPNKSLIKREVTPPFSPDGRAGSFFGLTGPANEDGFGRATEDEGNDVAAVLEG